MKKFFLLTVTVILIQAAFVQTVTGLAQKPNITIKINGYLFHPGSTIKTTVTSASKAELSDVRTKVEITDLEGNTVFKRTYYEQKLKGETSYDITKKQSEFKKDGYEVTAEVSSEQKVLKKTTSFFGVVSGQSELNLTLLFNIAGPPLYGLDGKTGKDGAKNIAAANYLISKAAPRYNFSLSPMFYDDLQNAYRTGNSEKAGDLLRKIRPLLKSKLYWNQTYCVADLSKSPPKELDWLAGEQTGERLLSNSSPSMNIVRSMKSKKYIFYTEDFLSKSLGGRNVLGASASLSKALSDPTESGLRKFFALCAQKMSDGQNAELAVVTGLAAPSHTAKIIKSITRSTLINISPLPKPEGTVSFKGSVYKKGYFYRLLENLETIAGDKNSHYKEILQMYFKYKHTLTDKKDKEQIRQTLDEVLKSHFSSFKFKPEGVTLTKNQGKIPVTIVSKADYDADLRMVLKTKSFDIKKPVTYVRVKPKENAFIIPVRALYGGNHDIEVLLYAGDRLLCRDFIPVNVIMPTTISFYFYMAVAFIFLIITGAFIFREVRHRKIG